MLLIVVYLQLAKKNQSGTGCIQTINFFSDGVEQNEYEKSLEVLKEGKAKERQVIIQIVIDFVYLFQKWSSI